MMEFTAASVQSIKSISQQALTRYWSRLAGSRSFPSIAEFDPEPRLHDPNQLEILDYRRCSRPATLSGTIPRHQCSRGIQLLLGRENYGRSCPRATEVFF